MSFRITRGLFQVAKNGFAQQRTVAALRIPAIRAASIVPRRTFINTAARLDKQAVQSALKQEIEHETSVDPFTPDPIIEDFLANSGFKVIEGEKNTLGQLLKETPEHTLRVFFDVAEVVNCQVPEVDGMEEDLPEDMMTGELVPLNLVIEKKADGSAVAVELMMQPGGEGVHISSIMHYDDAKLALEESGDAEYKRRLLYAGPRFDDLDENLQTSLEQWLTEQGVDGELLEFIYAYSDARENTEYVNWLKNLTKFFS